MSKVLVACFSASGVTGDAAKKIAEITGGTFYAICPKVPYTPADLDWRNPNSRSSVEMKDPAARPEMADGNAPVADSDVVFLGFPIWWYTAPRIVNTFLEKYDFAGKRIILFATSGSSGFEHSLADLKASVSDKATMEEGIVVHGRQDSGAWQKWIGTLGL